MKRLALMLAVLGLGATAGACDSSRGLTEPADRVQNIGTIGSGHREDGPITTQDNGGTSGSGHREGTAGGATTQSTGTSGSGLPDDVILENGGTIGSGH